MTPAAILSPAARKSPAPTAASFDFYGVRTVVKSTNASIADEFRRDFSWFETAATASAPRVELTLFLEPPPEALLAKFPKRREATRILDQKQVRLVYHPEGALVRHDFEEERGEVWCADRDRLHELGYILLLSRVGAALDAKGLHRVHGLGVVQGNRAALALLPIGGGKTTLAFGFLKNSGVKLLSEDTPLVDRRGRLWPFPVRFGVCSDSFLPEVPTEMQRLFRRRRWGTKVLVDLEYARGRLADRRGVEAPAVLFGGVFEPGQHVETARCSVWRLLPALVFNLLIGVGVPQGREYLLRPRVSAVWRLLLSAISRAVALAALLARARAYRLRLGSDTPANVRMIERLLA